MKFQKNLIIKIDTIIPVYLQFFIASTFFVQMWIRFLSVKNYNGICDFLIFESIYTSQLHSIFFIQFYCYDYIENFYRQTDPTVRP